MIRGTTRSGVMHNGEGNRSYAYIIAWETPLTNTEYLCGEVWTLAFRWGRRDACPDHASPGGGSLWFARQDECSRSGEHPAHPVHERDLGIGNLARPTFATQLAR
jgi:hypothetical protein